MIKILQVVGQDQDLEPKFFRNKVMKEFFGACKEFAKQNWEPNLTQQHEHLMPGISAFLSDCLQLDPRKRMTADEALMNPFFDDIRKENLLEKVKADQEIKLKIDELHVLEGTNTSRDFSVAKLEQYLV